MDEPVDEPEFTPDERECDLLARLAHRRLELQMRGAGQLAMGVAEASRLVWDWMRNPPGGALAEVHYTPGMQAEVRERDCDAKREMTAQEISAADRWLAVMAMLAREAVGQTEGGH